MSIVLNAAPTAWASDTNYASGPANGSATKVDPGAGRFAQGWVPGSTLPAQHINFHLAAVTTALADIISKVSNKAVDGVGGGTYTLTAPLVFAGAQSVGFTAAQVNASGTFTVVPTGKIDVISGGSIEVNEIEGIVIDDIQGFYRLTLTPESIAQSAGTPAWVGQPFGAGWLQSIVSSGFSITFPINLPPGDTLLSITVAVTGGFGSGHAALPAGTDRLNVELYQVSGNGVATSLARRFDQSASVGAYDGDHTITLQNGSVDAGAMPQDLDPDFAYYVVVRGETGANAVANTTLIQSISGQCVARTYRAELMVY